MEGEGRGGAGRGIREVLVLYLTFRFNKAQERSFPLCTVNNKIFTIAEKFSNLHLTLGVKGWVISGNKMFRQKKKKLHSLEKKEQYKGTLQTDLILS